MYVLHAYRYPALVGLPSIHKLYDMLECEARNVQCCADQTCTEICTILAEFYMGTPHPHMPMCALGGTPHATTGMPQGELMMLQSWPTGGPK